ncbi:hypothetical protein JOC78_001590 [Bacillus ectoiniformans]|nr:hypothetical protein [Bacillus ectoiniformans]
MTGKATLLQSKFTLPFFEKVWIAAKQAKLTL